MDSKSELGAAGDCEMYAFKFSLPAALAWSFCALIIRTPNVRPLCDTARSKSYDRKCINAVKFYRILRSLNLKFSPQNLIVPKF